MKSILYLLIFAATAFTIGWLFINHFQPQIVERGCSEMAQKSSDILFEDQGNLDPKYKYDNVKARCLEDSLETR